MLALFHPGQIPAAIECLVDCELEFWMLEHAKLCSLLSSMFGAIANFALFVVGIVKRRVFDGLYSAGHKRIVPRWLFVYYFDMQPITQTPVKPQPQLGLLDAIIIFDLLIPPLTWLMVITAGPDGAPGIGIFIGLILLPLWILCSIPVVILAIHGIRSAARMEPKSKTIRRVLCWIDLLVRIAITTFTVGYWIIVFTRGYI